LLIHDRDSKFGGGFDSVFQSEGIAVIRTPVQAPNANAHAERWVGSVRRECLERLLIFSRRQLEHVLRVYARHYNRHRPHRSLAFGPRTDRQKPDASKSTTISAAQSPRPTRRADPRIRIRSLTLPRRHAFLATLSLRHVLSSTRPIWFHARARIPDLPRRRQMTRFKCQARKANLGSPSRDQPAAHDLPASN
jgi:Integrase core domain